MPQCNLLGKGPKRQETLPGASGSAGHAALTHQQGAKALLLQAEIYQCNSVHKLPSTYPAKKTSLA